jgi:hypothetical protein
MHEVGDGSLAIGNPESIKARVIALFPQVVAWKKYQND